MRPLIGIPCHADFRQGSGRPIYFIDQTYSHAVESAGGIPVLIPMLHELTELESLFMRLDGILFSGGSDLHPSYYHEEARPFLHEVDPQLDEMEITLLQRALHEDLPILGICRGMQILNVVLGGSLYQDLGEQYAGSLEHSRRDLPRDTLIHPIYVEAGSQMEKILGTRELQVNSIHHQAIKTLGKGVRVSGRAEDGVPELLEVSNYRFVMATQCHPEEIYTKEPACARLFTAFVRACSITHLLGKEEETVEEIIRMSA